MTSPIENLEARLKAAEDQIALFESMIDPVRRVVAAEKFKVETGEPSPQIIETTDGGSLCLGSEGSMRVIGSITEGVSHTGDIDETEVGKITMPANSMGARGFARITGHFWADGITAGNRYYRMYFGGSNIAQQLATSATAMLDWAPHYVWNRGATNDQEGRAMYAPTAHSRTTEAPNIMAIDTTADVDVTFTVQNSGGAGLSSRLRFALVEAFYRD